MVLDGDGRIARAAMGEQQLAGPLELCETSPVAQMRSRLTAEAERSSRLREPERGGQLDRAIGKP